MRGNAEREQAAFPGSLKSSKSFSHLPHRDPPSASRHPSSASPQISGCLVRRSQAGRAQNSTGLKKPNTWLEARRGNRMEGVCGRHGMQLLAVAWPKFVLLIKLCKNTWFLSALLLQEGQQLAPGRASTASLCLRTWSCSGLVGPVAH